MLLTALIVYHIVFCLSSVFLKFFNFLFHSTTLNFPLFVVCSWFLTALIFYHVLVCLSSTFFTFFQHRLTRSFFKLCHSIFQTASVFYHAVFCLSRSFLIFLNYLFNLNFQNNLFICFVSNSFVSIAPMSPFVNYFFHFFLSSSNSSVINIKLTSYSS